MITAPYTGEFYTLKTGHLLRFVPCILLCMFIHWMYCANIYIVSLISNISWFFLVKTVCLQKI